MTRGRCGSLSLQRMTLSFTTPRRFIPAHKEKHMASSYQPPATGPWDTAFEQLRDWDPGWVDTCVKMSTNPWTSGVLPRKFIELVSRSMPRVRISTLKEPAAIFAQL
jgi:hypothetical protein